MVAAHALTAITAILGLAAAEFVSRFVRVDQAIVPVIGLTVDQLFLLLDAVAATGINGLGILKALKELARD